MCRTCFGSYDGSQACWEHRHERCQLLMVQMVCNQVEYYQIGPSEGQPASWVSPCSPYTKGQVLIVAH